MKVEEPVDTEEPMETKEPAEAESEDPGVIAGAGYIFPILFDYTP